MDRNSFNFSDIRVTTRIQNNILLNLIESCSSSRKEFSIKYGINDQTLYLLINFRIPYKKKRGGYIKPCKDIAKIFNVIPEIIFPDRFDLIDRNKITNEVNIEDRVISSENNALLIESAEDSYIKKERKDLVRKALCVLSERERRFVCKFFGIDDYKHTYGEIAKEEKISNGRACQIVRNALCKLKTEKESNKYLQLAK